MNFVDGELDSRSFAKRVRLEEPAEHRAPRDDGQKVSSLRRVDLIVNAGHQVRLGNYDARFKLYGTIQG